MPDNPQTQPQPQSQPQTDPPPTNTPPADPPPAKPPVVVQHSDNTGILQALNALPEKLADAVKEMVPQTPATPVATQDAPPASPPAKPAANEPAKKRSFGELWFGVKR